MTYNLTEIAKQNSTLQFTQKVNTVLMDGWLGTLLLMSLATVMFISYYQTTQDAGKSLSATAYLSIILASFLRALNLIPNMALFITIILAAMSIALTWGRT